MSMKEVVTILAAAASPPFLFVALVLYLFSHPEKLDQWANLFFRSLSALARYSDWIAERIEHGLVASDIQAAVNTAGHALAKEAPGVLPYALKVEWVKEQDEESFVRDGEVIVRLRHHTNPERNLVAATLPYLKKALLPNARRYVGHLLVQAVDFAVAKRIFAATKETDALGYFHDNVVAPAVEAEQQLQRESELIDVIDGVGFFTRIFLPEVKYFGERVFPAHPSQRLSEEVKLFANYLRVIATKGKDEDVPLAFISPRLKINIVLVARRTTLETTGIDSYIRRIRFLIREGFESIYINGWGEEYVSTVRDIIKRVKSEGMLRIVSTDEFPVPRYRGDINRGILVTCHSSASFLARQRESTDLVRNALFAHVPGLLAGDVEIVEIARTPGVGTKVALRSTLERAGGMSAADMRRGSRVEWARSIKQDLPDEEWLGVIDWDADLVSYICNALYPLNPADVVRVELDEANLEAHVIVGHEQPYAKAVGKNGENVRLASELVGWRIKVLLEKEAPTTDADLTSPVIEALQKHVPEIGSGGMEIVQVAREVGFSTKVAVRVLDRRVARGTAVQLCVGPGRKRFDAIRNQLHKGEHLRIVDCGSGQEAFITQALYPLREWEVLRVHVDQDERRATVVVRDAEAAAKAIGVDGQNVRLAQRLTGWQIDVLREDQHST
jgi:transcription antitermination factor NusA-like protein